MPETQVCFCLLPDVPTQGVLYLAITGTAILECLQDMVCLPFWMKPGIVEPLLSNALTD